MHRFISAILLLLSATLSQASPATDLYVQLVSPGGPYGIEEVTAATPSPLLTGYQAKLRKCELLVNVTTYHPETDFGLFEVVHEAGHCFALRDGLTDIDHPGANDEKVADMFAIAWLKKYLPSVLAGAFPDLMEHRKLDRRIDARYDTFMAIRRAQMLYTDLSEDPWAFTKRQFTAVD